MKEEKKTFDLLAMGELLLRLSPPNNERITRGDVFEKHIGGAELNVAAGVSLLGLHTGMISRIPDTEIGEFAKNKIRYLGVSDDYLVWVKVKRPDWGYIIMRALPIPENRRWCMTESTRR